MTPPDKTCQSCGRRISWRRKWERDWDEVRYCSAGCRRRRTRPQDTALERSILDLLEQRPAGATICPSEAARQVFSDGWQGEMESVRMAARRLAAAGEVVIVQGGRPVDPSTAKGPIRIRRRQ